MAVIRISVQRCKGCLLCISVCPHKALRQGERLNRRGDRPVEFDQEKRCSGCCQCALICPESCIEVYEE